MEKVPEYTELEKQRMKDKYNALTLEQKQKVREAFVHLSNVIDEPKKQEIATLTYKQLAQNFKDQKGVKVHHEIRQVIRRMNKDKHQVNVVNGPGSVIQTTDGKFMITKKGKSLRIGD